MATNYQIHRSSFDGGLDGDINKAFLPANKYTNAENVTLSGLDGRFFSLENLKGTKSIANLFTYSATKVILGAFYAKFTIGTTINVPCVVVFSATADPDYTFNIHAVKLSDGTIYELYERSIPTTSDYFSQGGQSGAAIDIRAYPEAGLDILYFTDNYFPIGKLRCEIPSGYSPNFLSDEDIDLPKKRSIGKITLDSVTTGGSLLTGTYQLAYQLINPEKNKYTKFSLLTTPIHVYTIVNGFTAAGIGLPSNKKIRVDITPTEDELAFYTHFRVAVVENIYPEGVDAAITSEIGLTSSELISTYLSSGVIQNYEITSNTQIDTETIDNIVIDLAAIEKVKTLEVSNNRLFLANIAYKDLDYDNGAPGITGGSILKQEGSTGDSYSSDDFTSKYKGHFRGEVYRYSISYFDGAGNFSSPKTLDVSGITNNQISGTIDMKFPERSQYVGSINYSLLSTATARSQGLGLRLTAVDNHPTWAHGFVILRAKRKKDIEFQTPLVPMSPIAGIGAVGDYPSLGQEGPTPTAVSYTNAVPMGPNVVYYPTNLFYGGPVGAGDLVITPRNTSGTSTYVAKGENNGQAYVLDYDRVMLFPPDNIYKNSAYSFKGNEQLKTIDAISTRLYLTKFSSSAYDLGEYIETSCAGTFFASADGDYYYDSIHTGGKAALRSGTASISDVKAFDNYGAGDSLGGVGVWDKEYLTTTGAEMGIAPNTQRSAVGILNTARAPLCGPTVTPPTFTSGTPVSVSSGLFGILTNNEFISNTTGIFASRVNVFEIVNVINGLQDTRYGDADSFNEFIFTGTQVNFTNAELATVQAGATLPKTVDVWGGDCIISPHTFKVSDSVYVITNQSKADSASPSGWSAAGGAEKWGRSYLSQTGTPSGATIMMPVPVKNAAQYINMLLESEYHGSARDTDTFESVGAAGTYNWEIPGIKNENSCRTSMSYKYNINLNKENDQKIFVPLDPLIPEIENYKSRIMYSDIKIYQSNIDGFDSIRVLNYYDLPESGGSIKKLTKASNSLYAVQDNSIVYIPIGERIIETTDVSTLGVKSGDVINDPVFIDTKRGSQHTGGVLSNGESIFIFDGRRKQIYKVTGQQLSPISEAGLINPLRDLTSISPVNENDMVAFYDYSRRHYWIASKSGFCYIWNDKYNLWETKVGFPANTLHAGVYADDSLGFNYDDQLLLVGNLSGNYNLSAMHSGDRTSLFGNVVTPKVSFIVNPTVDIGKIFEAILINSNNRLSTLDFNVEREIELGNQTLTSVPLDPSSLGTRGEGNYKFKLPNDAVGARPRGLFGEATLYWPSGSGAATAKKTNVSSVLTKYQISENSF